MNNVLGTQAHPLTNASLFNTQYLRVFAKIVMFLWVNLTAHQHKGQLDFKLHKATRNVQTSKVTLCLNVLWKISPKFLQPDGKIQITWGAMASGAKGEAARDFEVSLST